MGIRKYYTEQQDVEYMLENFDKRMNRFFDVQINQSSSGIYSDTSMPGKIIFVDLMKDLDSLADMHYEHVSLTTKYQLAQQIKQKIMGLKKSVVETNTLYNKCINLILAFVDYYYVDKPHYSRYMNLIDAYNRWITIWKYNNALNCVRKIMINVFTR